MDMLFIAASTVTTGKLSTLIRQGPDCRRQSSWQRGEGLWYPANGREKHSCRKKSENAPNAKLTPMQVTMQDSDEAGWLHQKNLLWLEKKKHCRLFYQNPLRKDEAFGHCNRCMSAAGAACQGAVRACWTETPTVCIHRPWASASLRLHELQSHSRLVHERVGWAGRVASLRAARWMCTFRRSPSLTSFDSF